MSYFDKHTICRSIKHVTAVSFFLVTLTGCSLLTNVEPKPISLDLEASSNVLDIRQVWVSRVGTATNMPFDINVVNNSVTVASGDGTVATIDSTTGKDLWRLSLGESLTAGVGGDGKLVAVVSGTNFLIGISAGQVLWREPLSAQVFTPPLVAGGRVFVLAADRSISAYDASSGQRLWIQRRTGESLVLRRSGVLLAVGDTLVASGSGRLVGLDPINGSVSWDVSVATARGTNDVERLVELVGRASRVTDSVCVRSFQSAVGCVDVLRGSVEWVHSANGYAGVDGDRDALFGVESSGVVVAWRRSNGERLWESNRLRYRKLTAPLLLGRSVVVGDSSGLLHFFSRVDGLPLNRVETDASGLIATPVVAKDTLIVVTRNGSIYGFRPN